jgi:RNA polymerase sigma-70 factor (ECF subfamily)
MTVMYFRAMKENSFRHTVLPLRDKLFRLALRITLNREDAEDIVQETLIRVWRQMQQEDIDNVEALAMTICRNLSIDCTERRERLNISFDSDLHDQPDHASAADANIRRTEQQEQVNQMLNCLPEKQRTALQLRDIEGRPYREIANVMQISESDVKVNIFRARQKLKELVENNPIFRN